jgi:hypothetical protein
MEQPQVRDTTLKLQDVIAEASRILNDSESQQSEELTEYGDIFVMKRDDSGWIDSVYH